MLRAQLRVLSRHFNRVITRAIARRGTLRNRLHRVRQRQVDQRRPSLRTRPVLRVMRVPLTVQLIIRRPYRRQGIKAIIPRHGVVRLLSLTQRVFHRVVQDLLRPSVPIRSRARRRMMLRRCLYTQAKRIRYRDQRFTTRVARLRGGTFQRIDNFTPCSPSRAKMSRAMLIAKNTSKMGTLSTRIPYRIQLSR